MSPHHKSHSIKDGGKKHKEKVSYWSQSTRFTANQTSLPLNHAEQVCRAEIYLALHVAHSNYSLAFTQGDSKRFRLMFPNCLVALGYAQPDAKIRCNLQFDIAPYYKEQLIHDVKRRPFTFAFDESTSTLVGKQHDGYVQYWSDNEHRVLNRYCWLPFSLALH